MLAGKSNLASDSSKRSLLFCEEEGWLIRRKMSFFSKKMCQVKMLNSEPDVLIFKILICSDNLLISAFVVHLP